MLLTDVRNYIADAGIVSRTQIANRFGIEPEAVSGMLDALVTRGDIRPCATDGGGKEAGCKCDSGCGCCAAAASALFDEAYEWIGRLRTKSVTEEVAAAD